MPSKSSIVSRKRSSLPPPTPLQAIRPSSQPIVCLAFSPTGQYLAAALQHGTILLYQVLPFRGSSSGAPVIHPKPFRTFRGHTADVLHLSFSPTHFLASASMDRSVRLWHTNSNTCLRILPHPDMATTAAFNPADENLLMTGSCDGRARIWRLAENRVVAEAEAGTVITTAAFTSPRRAAVGTYDGRVLAWRPHPSTAPGMPNSYVDNISDTMIDARSYKRSGSRAARLSCTVVHSNDPRKQRTIFTAEGGRAFEVRDNVLTKRMRGDKTKRAGTAVAASASSDGRFVLLDAAGGSVRLMDIATADDVRKSKERDSSTPVAEIGVLHGGRHVTSATIACEAARRRCGRGRVIGDAVMMAVAGDDGSLTIVEQQFPSL